MEKKFTTKKDFEVKKVLSKIKNKNYKSNDEIDNILQGQIENIYNRDWNKLEKGFQKNRLNMFIETEVIQKKLSLSQKKNLQNIIFNSLKKNIFDNNTINYDIEKGMIEDINILSYGIQTKLYTITNLKPSKRKKKTFFPDKQKKSSKLINKYFKSNNDYKEKLSQEKIITKMYIDNLKD